MRNSFRPQDVHAWQFVPVKPFTMYKMKQRIARLFSKRPRWRKRSAQSIIWKAGIVGRKAHQAFFDRNRPRTSDSNGANDNA